MANPNPSPETRFGAGNNCGRAKQKGARDRLSAKLLTDFADDYEAHGKAVIETVRGQDPVAYMRIAASLLPKLLEIEERTPESELTDDQVEEFYAMLSARLAARKAKTVESPPHAPSSQPVN
jgi:hypothetical protein